MSLTNYKEKLQNAVDLVNKNELDQGREVLQELIDELYESQTNEEKDILATALDIRSLIRAYGRDFEGSMKDLDESISLRRFLFSENFSKNQEDIARLLTHKGINLGQMGKLDEALSQIKEAIKLYEECYKNGSLSNAGLYTHALNQLAITQKNMNNFESSFEAFNKAIDILEKETKVDSSLNLDLAITYMNRGINNVEVAKTQDSIDDFRKSIDIVIDSLKERPELVGLYSRLVYYSILSMARSGLILPDKMEKFKTESEYVFNTYGMTEEAEFWMTKIGELFAPPQSS
ncbi:Tetratricopeptide TPR_1 repeat-containing protein [Thermodesulfobium narugense DSM 14796]|uniref:Tetratricopeptide TPR_1 repeat-containing protein n=1 Tax=Thermodesulfobium narugense DSM 14796 TaxID=747365 RepID=M1E8X1_9BACT|nr:tetratricopeptide repeat protein [Thermodesulfobium narugense]AEE15428.1 Tetratricopeptide TPR_1 repeat-containing protein [Thermodesulfobium narugense DSM 14796]